MNTHSFEVVCRNHSAYPIDIVWENALDLEHVAYLHSRTNFGFQLLFVQPSSDAAYPYDALFFTATRKILGVVPATSIGMRRVVGPHEIWQVERNPLLGITTRLRSTLTMNAADPRRTDMVDYVEVTVPKFLTPLEDFLRKSLQRHTKIQCAEDEAFRARRAELRERGIVRPYCMFNKPLWELKTEALVPGSWRGAGAALPAWAPAVATEMSGLPDRTAAQR